MAACAAVVIGAAPAASAAESGSTSNKDVCGQAASTADLTRGLGTPAPPLATTGRRKEGLALFGPRPPAAQRTVTAVDARKRAMVSRTGGTAAGCAGRTADATPAFAASATIPGMVQYRQNEWYFCGPAVVSEMSATVPGPSPYNLNQYDVAAYTHTITPTGTMWDQELSGIRKYVGVPDFGWDFYTMAWVSWPITAQESADFDRNLATDVSNGSPIAGLAEEVAGGPHLVGHPVNLTLGHYIEIGGYNASQVWYADSYTGYEWAGVARYSWFDKATMKDIIGEAGYIW